MHECGPLALLKESGAEISDVKVSNFRERGDPVSDPAFVGIDRKPWAGSGFEAGPASDGSGFVAARAARGLQSRGPPTMSGKLRRHKELKADRISPRMSGLDGLGHAYRGAPADSHK